MTDFLIFFVCILNSNKETKSEMNQIKQWWHIFFIEKCKNTIQDTEKKAIVCYVECDMAWLKTMVVLLLVSKHVVICDMEWMNIMVVVQMLDFLLKLQRCAKLNWRLGHIKRARAKFIIGKWDSGFINERC